MTLKEIQELLETSGYPVAYLSFPADKAPSMPFITWQETGSNNISADGHVYKPVRTIQVDLFTRSKDPTAEAALESVFNDFFWNKIQTLDNTEDCQRYTYEIEVFGG